MLLSFFNLPPFLQAGLAGFISALWSIAIPQIPGIGLLLSPFLLVPLFFVSFSVGLRIGLQAGLISTFFVFLLASPLAGCGFFILHFVPFMMISALFHQHKRERPISKDEGCAEWSYGAGTILSNMTGGFLFVIVGGLILMNSQNIDWQQNILQHLDQIAAQSASLKLMVEKVVGWLPSLLGVSMIASLTANAYVAQRLLEKTRNNLRVFQKEDWQIPLCWDIVVVLGMMMWSLGKFFGMPQTLLIAKTVITLGCVPLGFIGLRICYLRLNWQASGRLWFRLLCVLSFLLVWPLIFIVLLGFIESWYGLTQRFSKNQRDTHL